MSDRATQNKSNPADNANLTNSGRQKFANGQMDLTNTPNNSNKLEPPKDGPSESGSLNKFREAIKDVLEEITSLEVNTMIVGSIPMTKFDAQDFYTNLIENTMCKTEGGLQERKRSLLERSTELKQKGSSLSQSELERYNQDLEIYKRAERAFSDRQNSTENWQKEQFKMEQACYEEIANKVFKLTSTKNSNGKVIPDVSMICYFHKLWKDSNGKVIPDASMVRYFRKLWEFEQSVLNGELIYAQTKFQLDGDLTNKFVNDLFVPSIVPGRIKIDTTMAKLVFDLHHQAVENAQKQWSGLITTCVNLVKDLMPFRSK